MNDKYTLLILVYGYDKVVEVEITKYSYGLGRWHVLDGRHEGEDEDTEHEAIARAYEYVDEVHGEIVQVIKDGENIYA